jgi:hypothetical protein
MDQRIVSYAKAQPDQDTRVPGMSAGLPVCALSNAIMDASPDTSTTAETPATTSKRSCIYAELLDAVPIAFERELCCTVGQGDQEGDYFLLEHIRSGHYNSQCPSLAVDENAAVELAPVRMEMPFDAVHCLTPVTLQQPLLSSRHIRLIALHPQCRFESGIERNVILDYPLLHCEVFQTSLDEISTKGQPLFMAVSYVCGDQRPVRHIRCGTESVGIPENAYDALLHFRLSGRPRLVWIDCLCINQNVTQEKSHQVRILHKIYSQAHVVSWLGTGDGIDLQCASFYIPLLAQFWIITLRTAAKREWRETCSLGIAKLNEYLVAQATVPHPHFSADAIVSIFKTGYFGRVWIVQEIVLGRTNTFQIGDALFSVAVLTAAVMMLLDCSRDRASILEFESPYDTSVELETITSFLQPALHKHWSSHDFRLERLHDLNIVVDLNRRSCSDHRDRIYGLVSLFQAPDTYDVDYTLSLSEVFADFTVHCMLNGQGISATNFERLAMGNRYPYSTVSSSLASWCPDWTFAGSSFDLKFTLQDSRHCGWRASGGHEIVHTRPSKVTLVLRGLAVTRLKMCCVHTLGWVTPETTDRCELIWLEQSESLCTFFESLGVQINHGTIDLILRVFDRLFIPKTINIISYDYAKDDLVGRFSIARGRSEHETLDAWEFSPEMRSLFEQVDTNHHVRNLLAPVYLAKVDPKLYRAAGFEVDARIPLGDFISIEETVMQMLYHWSCGTRLFITENGLLGTGYEGIKEDDLVCIIYGSDVPQILRQVGDEGHYILVGACNVDGLMFGEGLEMGLEEQDFILV